MSEFQPNKSSGTEYRLSVSSNPNSRRSSLVGHKDTYNTRASSLPHDGKANFEDDDANLLDKYLRPQLNDLHDSVVTMDDNFLRLNNIHENLVDLNESFGSLLYGIIVNSACINFAGFPTDTREQLEVAKALHSIQQEKRALLEELDALQKPETVKPGSSNSGVNSGTGVKRGQFSQPIFTTAQAKRITAKSNGRGVVKRAATDNQRNRFSRTRYNDENSNRQATTAGTADADNDDDDNSSEASFVLNPGRDDQSQYTFDDSGTANPSRKMRRKSVLNVVRNSVNTNERPPQLARRSHTMGPQPSRAPDGRRSIGGRGPMRRVHNPAAAPSGPAPGPRNSVQGNTAVRTTSRPKSIDKRPPFR
ncbi:Dam1p KNAG_0B00920 [Huiozyma naganishii CBS 8797]|uniref:DASH complex subunit DAM1 n=1 Tax=Huiozyma naganishii (strain ATCC MYA-139 / BCRC 22969 / CBS 8797 / KCTC 17520 / NBRC 10181 / NCYC 3082 / Yp74L-3) TaxID=1071383 RepID=J7S376_HUIN7|nr:hypothetical protein KNAG_0B00920 [Kazachstania naganishii CBS 8797]CCK68539.1 hypothetical protein KNAG_0B00920 [Kazachstania naganishii CBS 8797]